MTSRARISSTIAKPLAWNVNFAEDFWKHHIFSLLPSHVWRREYAGCFFVTKTILNWNGSEAATPMFWVRIPQQRSLDFLAREVEFITDFPARRTEENRKWDLRTVQRVSV